MLFVPKFKFRNLLTNFILKNLELPFPVVSSNFLGAGNLPWSCHGTWGGMGEERNGSSAHRFIKFSVIIISVCGHDLKFRHPRNTGRGTPQPTTYHVLRISVQPCPEFAKNWNVGSYLRIQSVFMKNSWHPVNG